MATALSQPAKASTTAGGPKPTVILVHGIFDSERAMRTWKKLLTAEGYEAHSITFQPGDGRASISELAAQLDAFILEHIPADDRFHLIGHSMGGLVMRCYAQRFESARRISGLVTLGSPHHGSLWAWTQPTPGGRDMRVGSALLRDLAANDHRLAHLKPLSIWTPLDLMILPSTSSFWRAAQNDLVWLPSHPNLKHSRWLTKRVLKYLRDRESIAGQGTTAERSETDSEGCPKGERSESNGHEFTRMV